MADEPSVIYNTTTQTCLTKARPDVDGDCYSLILNTNIPLDTADSAGV